MNIKTPELTLTSPCKQDVRQRRGAWSLSPNRTHLPLHDLICSSMLQSADSSECMPQTLCPMVDQSHMGWHGGGLLHAVKGPCDSSLLPGMAPAKLVQRRCCVSAKSLNTGRFGSLCRGAKHSGLTPRSDMACESSQAIIPSAGVT